MESTYGEIDQLLSNSGAIVRRENPQLSHAIDWRVPNKRLVRILRGVYVRPQERADLLIRIMAVSQWDRDAVLLGEAAAKTTFWPNLPVGSVTVSLRNFRTPQPGFRFARDHIPAELLVQKGILRATCPALTALDLALVSSIGGNGIDQALRTRACTRPR